MMNKDIVYNVIQLDNCLYIMARQRAKEAMARFGTSKVKIRGTLTGEDLLGLTATDPLFGRQLQLYDYQNVTDKYGSGIEPICPAHDVESMLVATQYDNTIPAIGRLLSDGTVDPSLGPQFAGVSCATDAGNQLLGNRLKELKRVVWSGKGENVYSVEKSTGQRVVLRTEPAWFVKASRAAKGRVTRDSMLAKCVPKLESKDYEQFKREAEEEYRDREKRKNRAKLASKRKEKRDSPVVDELYHHMKSYYLPFVNAVEEMSDLCVSEPNPWSIPIPCFARKDTKELFMNSTVLSHIARLYREKGSDIWYTGTMTELLPVEFSELRDQLEKTYESFTPDFIGSLAPHYCQTRGIFPRRADLMVECYDQHDEWVSQTAVTSSLMGNGLPFSVLKTHGKVVDEFGDPLKSLVYPVDIIDGSAKIDGERRFGLGADVLRIWASVNDTDQDFVLKEKHMDLINRKLRALRSVCERAFVLVKDDPEGSKPVPILSLVDEYMLTRLSALAESVRLQYDSYFYTKTFETISQFVSAFLVEYLQIVSRELRGHKEQIEPKRALRSMLDALSLMLHPMAPYTSAEMREALGEKVTAEKMQWPKVAHSMREDEHTYQFVDYLFGIRHAVREQLDELKRLYILRISRLR